MSHCVALVVFDGLEPFEAGMVVKAFAPARRPPEAKWWYELAVCSADPAPLQGMGGFAVMSSDGLDAVATADTVFVPGYPRTAEPVPERVTDALRAAHARGARLAAICSGAFVLAATGLLNGRRVVSHWSDAAALRERYPAIEVDQDALYLDEGAILTSAGGAAGLDLCLHIIRRDHGAAIANRLARRLVMAPHRNGDQAQLVDRLVSPAEDRRLHQAVEWALGRLAEPTTLADLAQHAFMSPRTFTRRFRETFGQPPMAWLLDQRLDASLAMLEEHDAPVEQIARAVGFTTAAGYRKRFRDRFGISPIAHRRAFRDGDAGQLSQAASSSSACG